MAMVLRPGFLVDVAISSRELIERLEAALAAGPMQIKRTRVPGGGEEPGTRSVEHLVLTVPDAQQHFWSPWLTIELSPGDAGTHLRATFSPHPSVWTGFAFGYLTMTVVLVASLVIASTASFPKKKTMNPRPWSFLSAITPVPWPVSRPNWWSISMC